MQIILLIFTRGLRGPCGNTGPVPAMKSEATAIFAPQDGRWKITVSFDGRRFCVPKFRLIKQTGKSCVHKITANYLVQIE